MRKLLLIACALAAISSTHDALAVTNMPLVCPVTVAAGKCDSPSYVLKPGGAGLFVVTPDGVWHEWASLASDTLIRVCPADVEAGLTCPTARISMKKVDAASEMTLLASLKVSWTAPTLDVSHQPLASDAIVGYNVNFHADGSPDVSTKTLANVTSVSLSVPATKMWVAVQTIGKNANSAFTAEVSAVPKAAVAAAPAQPGGVVASFEETPSS
jgi:hypothetical protein